MKLFGFIKRPQVEASPCNDTWVTPGHFYSPITDSEEVEKRENYIFDKSSPNLAGNYLNTKEQFSLLEAFKGFYLEQPSTASLVKGHRYYFKNEFYSYSNVLFLYHATRHFKPKNIIEIGPGFSSFCILDTNEKFFRNSICCQFIEPYPERLRTQLKPGDRERIAITEKDLQDVDLGLFDRLNKNDLLVINSTRVVKTDSDVNRIFSRFYPALMRGYRFIFTTSFSHLSIPKECVY